MVCHSLDGLLAFPDKQCLPSSKPTRLGAKGARTSVHGTLSVVNFFFFFFSVFPTQTWLAGRESQGPQLARMARATQTATNILVVAFAGS